jgi:hypothetical protein
LLKKKSFSSGKNVSVGHAAVGATACLPVGALMRLRTFSCETISVAPPRVVLPAFPIASFPPV